MTPEAAHVMEHGLRGLASLYLSEQRVLRERRAGTLNEVRGSIRRFLRWAWRAFDQEHGSRLDPHEVLQVRVFASWWDWMLSDDRVERVTVKRRNRTYEREYKGPLARSSAYKEWTTLVKFWRWAAQVEEVQGLVPMCPTERLKKPYRDPSKKRAARRRSVAATWTQAAQCIALVPDWVRPVAVLCYYTGLRIGQAQAITWDDVFLEGREADDNGGPVIWVGSGKAAHESDGRYLPVHPSLAKWLRTRRAQRASMDDLPPDLRRTATKAYKARLRGLEEGRVAWEAGDQPLASQLKVAWQRAEVDPRVWEHRTAHAFRKAFRTNIVNADVASGGRVWQAAERLLGHALPGQIDTYQDDRVLMPVMRRLVESIPAWEQAAQEVEDIVTPSAGGKVIALRPTGTDDFGA